MKLLSTCVLLFTALLTLGFSQPHRAEEIVSRMSLPQLVGQLLFIGITKKSTQVYQKFSHDWVPGGVILYSHNIGTNLEVKKLTEALQNLSLQSGDIPLFIGVDQEGGRVVRIRSEISLLPSQMALGAARSPKLAYFAGLSLAKELRALGINVNFSPVLDIQYSEKNPAIGDRSFGGIPVLVSLLGFAAAQGMKEGGILPVAKHFPGHGAARLDSHDGIPVSTIPLLEMQNQHLLPFWRLVQGGMEAVLTAHVAYPSLEEDGITRPASLSKRILTELLRNTWNFDGLIITDDLEMGSIEQNYAIGEAAIQAILAGADMVMVGWSSAKQERVFRDLLTAINNKRIPLKKVKEAVLRITKIKMALQDYKKSPPPVPPFLTLNNLIAEQAVTLLQNKIGLLPLTNKKAHVVLVTPVHRFGDLLKKSLPHFFTVDFPSNIDEKSISALLLAHQKIFSKEALIIVGMTQAGHAFFTKELLKKTQAPVIGISFGDPWLLSEIPGLSAALCTFGIRPSLLKSASDILLGKRPAHGKMPLNLFLEPA